MLKYAIKNEVGNRQINEDYVGVAEKNNQYCFIVCDGLGGHGMGDVASKIVTDVFIEEFNKQQLIDTCLSNTFIIAQDRLIEQQLRNGTKNKMKTTAAVLATGINSAFIGHIGDSRVYVFSQNKVLTRTLDHSVSQILALSGEISEKEIRNHPDRNVILRAMGTEWDRPMFELMQPITLDDCQAFLLCSDGFWEYIDENEMSELLRKSSCVEEWLQLMTSVVLDNGKNKKMDNYSAIAVWNTNYSQV